MCLAPKVRKFRVLFFLLAFFLAFAPVSAWAATGKTQEINYVSLGDSLAHGLLSDGKTIGTSFADNIKKSLESNGYKVAFTNKGFSGFTTEHVLNGLSDIKELKKAHIVTISAGANDLLAEIDLNLLKKFKPDYLNPAKVEELKAAEKQKIVNSFTQVEQQLTGLNQTIAATETEINAIIDNILTTYGLLMPTEMKKALDDTAASFASAKQNAAGAATDFSKAKTAFEAGDSNYKTLLNDAATRLDGAISNFNTILAILDNVPQNYKTLIPDLVKAQAGFSNLQAATKNAKAKVSDVTTAAASLEEIDEIIKRAPEIQQMVGKVQQKVTTVGENIGKIVATIKQQNPSANIYVMGYYNAFPYFSKETQQLTVPLIQGLNTAIQKAAESTGAIFVPTYSVFEGKHETYLPNPDNIHPNEQGYSAIAKAFMKEINKKYPSIVQKIPSSVTVKVGKKVTVYKGQKVKISGTKTTIVMPKDLPDGTTLKVTKTSNSKIKKAKNLKSVGDALNFKFEFPKKSKNYKGKYKLTMGYKSNSPDKVAIYYYDTKSKKWKKQSGKNDKKAKQITLTVSKISDYGVFSKVEKSTKKK